MPISRRALVRSTILAILAGLGALCAIVGTTIWLVQKTEDYAREIAAIRRERAAYVDLLTLLQDLETGQRGYLLTGEEEYLAPYNAAMAKIGAQAEIVKSRASIDGSAKMARIARLLDLLQEKQDELGGTIALVREGRRAEAVSVVQEDRGRLLMDEARGIFGELIAAAESRFAAMSVLQSEAISWLRLVTFGSALVIFAVVAGSIWMVVVYMRQMVEAQKEVAALNTDLERRVSERTADLGRANDEIQRFAYIVTHDLRAPLVNVMGFTSELESSLSTIQSYFGGAAAEAADELPEPTPPLDPEAARTAARTAAFEDLPEAIGFIRSSTRKMDALINAILKLSRDGRRTLRPERIDLEPLLHATAAAIRHQVVEAGGEVVVTGRAPTLVTDRLALEQIFGNLLDNAVKYSAEGRPLAVTLRMRTEPGGLVAVDIEDNGRGIAERDHERIFELFRRSGAQDRPGEGIGLAHVRTMVRYLGGDISVKSELGVGTTFTVTFAQDLRRIAKT